MNDAARWVQAQRRADALDDPARVRAGRRALLPLLLGGVIAGLVSGVISPLVRLLIPSSATDVSGEVGVVAPSALFWVGLGLTVSGLVVSVAMLVTALVAGRLVIVTNRVEAVLSARQRCHVNQMLRGRERVGEDEFSIARAIAEQRVGTVRALVPFYVCLGVVIIGVVVMFADVDVVLPLLFGGLGVAAALALVLDGVVHVRPARRFLEQHL